VGIRFIQKGKKKEDSTTEQNIIDEELVTLCIDGANKQRTVKTTRYPNLQFFFYAF